MKKRNYGAFFLGAGLVLLVILIVCTVTGIIKLFGGQKDEEWILAGYKITEYDQGGEAVGVLCWKFEYDAQGKKRNAVRCNEDGSITEQYKFDEKGNRIRDELEGNSCGGFGVVQTVNEYDEEGELIRTVGYNQRGDIVLENTSKIEYDSEGRKIKVTSYSDNKVHSIDEYEYDSKGRKMKKERYLLPHGDVSYTWTDYTYDDQGGWTESTIFNPESGWSNGGTVRWVRSYDAVEDQQTYCRYDVEGRLLEKKFKKYEYDEYGNLVRAVWGNDSDPSIAEFGLAAAYGREICKAYDFDRDYMKLEGMGYNPVNDMTEVCGIFGLPTKETFSGNPEWNEWVELNYEYDKVGNLVKAEVTDASAHSYLGGNFIFEYGRRDELEKVFFYDADGNIQLCQEYEYTKK